MKELTSFSLSLVRLPALFTVYLMALAGCAVNQGDLTGQQDVTEDVSVVVEKEPIRSFDSDTVYDLLVAELGGQRKRYDMALGNYLKQAHKTQDAGIAARAYQISLFLGAKQASLDAAMLWTELAPNDVNALQASAIELVRAGQLERAIGQMHKALEKHGQADFDFLASGAADLPEKEREGLLQAFNAILKEYPDHRSLRLGKAILLQQSGQNEEAIEICESLLRQDPEYVKALILKGRILNALGRGDEAETMLAEAVERHPERPRLRLLYARILVHLDKLDEARIQFEELLRKSPHDAEILMSLALISLENGMLEQSETYFRELLKYGQRTSAANYYLGRISEKKGNREDAIAYFLKVPPGKDFVRAQVAVVQLMLGEGELENAREHLQERRAKFAIHSVQLYLLEAEILVGAGEYAEALKVYDAGVTEHPETVSLLYARAMLQEKMGKLSGLENDLRAIIKIKPNHVAALNALGYTLADRTDRLKEALELIEKAYALDQEDPAILDSMGWVQYRLGNLEGALKYLQMAYERFPDHEVAAHLGEVLWMMGRYQEATTLWDNALEKKPESEILRETRERLENATRTEAGDQQTAVPVASKP